MNFVCFGLLVVDALWLAPEAAAEARAAQGRENGKGCAEQLAEKAAEVGRL